MTNITMPILYKKLKALGLPKKYVRSQGLPTWWSDELDNKPAAALEGASHIARRLQIDLSSLLQEEVARFKGLPHTKFKYRLQQEQSVPTVAYTLASGVAALISRATKLAFQPLPTSAQQVRAEILAQHDQINLQSILDYCWEHGIAVIHFDHYPKKYRKIAGLIQWQNDRPVIVLSDARKNPAYLAFDLAHELGHLVLGHVKKEDNLILVDEKIKRDSQDQEEEESNIFAVDLLVDKFDDILSDKNLETHESLNEAIQEIVAIEPSLNPDILALNYAWHTGEFPLANKTIKYMNEMNDEYVIGSVMTNEALEGYIDWDDLGDDVVDHLEQVLGD